MKKIIFIIPGFFYCYSLFAQNVGIGTPTPAYKLTVTTGVGYGIVHTNGSVSLGTYLTAGSGWLGTVTNHPLYFFTNDGTPTMAISNSGNVGIGTVTPSQKMDVNGSVHISNNLGIGNTTPGSPLSFSNALGKKISFWNGGANTDYGIGIQSGAMQLYTGGSDLITFGYGSSNAFTETMRYATGSGQLMIGTSLPAGKLHLTAAGEALRLSGTNPFLTFFDGSNNYKGYMWNNAGNIEIGTDFSNTNGEISLKTKGVLGLTVQSNGRVRVGDLGCSINTSGGLPKFSIYGILGFREFSPNNGEWAMGYLNVNNDQRFYIYYNGGITARILTDGDWETLSDFRLKENFENYKPVLEGIKKLDILTYHYKSDNTGKRSFGLIAQNLQQNFPELVSGNEKNKDEYLGIVYAKTGVLAIKAIQEQQQIIEDLQKQVEAVKAEIPMKIGKQQVIIDTQQKKIEHLEKRLSALENKIP